MAQQTAVEWLWRWIMDNPFGSFDDGVKAYNQAKAMEKQQITKAYNSAIPFKFGEQYYNETYQSNQVKADN